METVQEWNSDRPSQGDASIPGGYPRPGKLGPDNKATGRVQKTMERFINPWALEVMSRHPEIAICDQHALISNEKFYSTWLKKAGFDKKGENNPFGVLTGLLMRLRSCRAVT